MRSTVTPDSPCAAVTNAWLIVPTIAARAGSLDSATVSQYTRARRGDHRALVRRQFGEELVTYRADPAQVRGVQVAYRADRLGQDAGAERAVAAAALHRVDRLERVIEPEQVGVLDLVEHLGQPALARGEQRIPLGHVEPAPVQAEIDIAGAEQLAQLAVVALAFLPPGGDRGDRPLRVQRPGDRLQRGPALRAQQRNPHWA